MTKFGGWLCPALPKCPLVPGCLLPPLLLAWGQPAEVALRHLSHVRHPCLFEVMGCEPSRGFMQQLKAW